MNDLIKESYMGIKTCAWVIAACPDHLEKLTLGNYLGVNGKRSGRIGQRSLASGTGSHVSGLYFGNEEAPVILE